MFLKQSTARNRVVLMIDASDHITGKTGLTLTIKASKDGAAFGSISPTVTELEAGFYKLALTTSHTDTLGDFALHITSTGADPTDIVDQIVALLPGDAVTLQADQAVNVTKVNGTTQTAGDIIATIPTANQNADALLDRSNAVETGLTPRGSLRVIAAALAGKVSGADVNSPVFRNAVADSKDRITATTDASGNRTAISTDLT